MFGIILIHLPQKSTIHVGKYTMTMDGMGYPILSSTFFLCFFCLDPQKNRRKPSKKYQALVFRNLVDLANQNIFQTFVDDGIVPMKPRVCYVFIHPFSEGGDSPDLYELNVLWKACLTI